VGKEGAESRFAKVARSGRKGKLHNIAQYFSAIEKTQRQKKWWRKQEV